MITNLALEELLRFTIFNYYSVVVDFFKAMLPLDMIVKTNITLEDFWTIWTALEDFLIFCDKMLFYKMAFCFYTLSENMKACRALIMTSILIFFQYFLRWMLICNMVATLL